MTLLIDHLLELSRVARSEVHRRRVDLGELGHAIVADLRQAQPARQVEVDIAGDLVAHADPTLVRAVLENLLGNAWKYSALTPNARIELRGEVGEHAVYRVRDNGAGFDMAHAGKLFVPFQRLHSAEEFEGTGVGLATVQRIVRLHGGEVWADAAPGRGATFSFTLAPRPPAVDSESSAAAG
jgi:light-regulated signal transduction histidine kinase (bacteriophytochrome)